ncbi:MAG: M1 family metallopeptidase [Acidobacteria bacterium]|nr:M1 family metallopeptidase [Acidobacteriota bacterium]MBI3427730.1 M1 family metallopeptidase [Acidobacteriota bacterium]
MRFRLCLLMLIVFLAVACQPAADPKSNEMQKTNESSAEKRDVHSYGNPEQVRVKHVDLNLQIQFDRKVMLGSVRLKLERLDKAARQLKLDTRGLKITNNISALDAAGKAEKLRFTLGLPDKILGAPLTIELPAYDCDVSIEYETAPDASGLQWLAPAQTAGKKQPYMFTQSESIHARSWIPLQDSPAVRVTYSARIHTPKELQAVMSAEVSPLGPSGVTASGYHFKVFEMKQAIPPYLIALAVGDIAFKPLSNRTGVYAEPATLDKAAKELEDTEKMVAATEKLYGPYRWGRYDILVLPPSFPYGGMENPRLTFATPTILAGDKSLVSLIAHELAHSWSGNLVTNATWRDFWLNEGFTTYLERRIIEALYGRERAEMEAVLGRQTLERSLAEADDRDEILHIDLTGRDPDDGSTEVPYEKGALLLRQMEETFGRARFDDFLKGYFDHFAFQSITTADFVTYLKKNLLDAEPQLAAKIPLDEWLYKPGLPASAPQPKSDAFALIETQANEWLQGKRPAAQLPVKDWATQQWLHFLRFLPPQLSKTQLEELDRAFKLTQSGNAEIAHIWLLIAIRNNYTAADARLAAYLKSIGRQKLIRPLYEELVKTPTGRARAMQIYKEARSGYHPIAVTAVDKIVQWPGAR